MTRSELAALDRERFKLDGKGDHIAAKPPSDLYRQNYDAIEWPSRKRATRPTEEHHGRR